MANPIEEDPGEVVLAHPDETISRTIDLDSYRADGEKRIGLDADRA